MTQVIGTLLGAFVFLYTYYLWNGWYGENETFIEIHKELLYKLWWDTVFHSKASFRRTIKTWKLNSLILLAGASLGWQAARGVERFF